MIALLLALQGPPAPAPPWAGGRILSLTGLHVGARPALYMSPDEIAAGLTVQISTWSLP